MTPKEAIDYIENFTWSTTRLGLERTRELLERIGNPQKQLKFIHVAGSNGKGSTCAMLANVLRNAGYKVGLYISPYIQEFEERIQINGENIPGDRLADITEMVKAAAEAMEEHPSQFELVTAIGMEYFRQEKVHIVVLEVGMGGALDSTNAIDAPELAIITNIGLEHTEYLGDTLEKIAKTKAGIIKTGCTAVCYDGAPEVTEVVKADCAEKNVPLICSDFSKLRLVNADLEGQQIIYDGREYKLRLLGEHQLHNACVVFESIAAMRKRGWHIPQEAVETGLATTEWPARLEVVGRNPLFLLDGGHNPQCAEALATSLTTLLGGKKAVFLMGVLADKDYMQVLDYIIPFAKEFVCLTPFSNRALPSEKLAEIVREKGFNASWFGEDIKAGIAAAREAAGEDGIIVSFGSLYLVGHIRTELI